MFTFSIITPPKSFIIKGKILSTILTEISLLEKKDHFWEINIVFLDDEEIQKLNKQYRDIDSSTDVLSFHYFDDFSTLDSKEVAWEVIFSEAKITTQGKKYKLWSELEFYKLFIHSIFHVLGYDHESEEEYEIMKKQEDTIWKTIF